MYLSLKQTQRHSEVARRAQGIFSNVYWTQDH